MTENMLAIAKIAEDCGIRGAPVTLTWTALNRFAEAVFSFAQEADKKTIADLEAEIAQLKALAGEVIAAHEAECVALLSYENAEANFSDCKIECHLYENATIRASIAEKALRDHLAVPQPPENKA